MRHRGCQIGSVQVGDQEYASHDGKTKAVTDYYRGLMGVCGMPRWQFSLEQEVATAVKGMHE